MIKKILKILALVLIAAFVIIQFFRIDKANPPIVEDETIEAALSVPPDVALIMGRSCNDCHSHKTVYPWYSNIQPVAWWLKDHINEGRDELNFSQFNTYSAKKKAKKLEEICEEVRAANMPLPSYLWTHGDAVLSENDKNTLCDWTNVERTRLASEN
ncbi:MAG: heme-binding domain-containing protein [Chloracidobacterium sp.]|nr:heme-binding domain-containing protein [Chloracidobacterium sp.]